MSVVSVMGMGVNIIMMCLDCGNCLENLATYYCTARNEFVVRDGEVIVERFRDGSYWKKGVPGYECRRRRIRKDREDLRKVDNL